MLKMGSFSKLGIILCSVFGVIILFLVAELSYLFWWKKKLNKNTEQHKNATTILSFLFCWKKKNPISAINFYTTEELNSTAESTSSHHNQEKEKEEEEEEDLEGGGNSRETLLKELVEESVEAELIRLHNLCGPPRFLFTINEETKEDLLEFEDSRRRRSLSDVITTVDSPLTPFSSPHINHHGFNPLFESLTERELNKLRSSPPPKFKFLRDAEEKLMKRLVEEAEKMGMKNGVAFQDSVEEKDASFITLLNVNKQREKEIHQQEVSIQNSGSSKVLPLATSPSTFTVPLVRNR